MEVLIYFDPECAWIERECVSTQSRTVAEVLQFRS